MTYGRQSVLKAMKYMHVEKVKVKYLGSCQSIIHMKLNLILKNVNTQENPINY